METVFILSIFVIGCAVGGLIVWVALRAVIKERSVAQGQQIEALTSIRGELEERIKLIAGDALKSNQTSFLELAKSAFEENQKLVRSEDEKKQEAIKNLLKPVSDTLKEYKKNLTEIEKERQRSYGRVSEELKNVIETQLEVRAETGRLVNALRANPKTRGRWGEETLKNVLEMSGLSQYCDFDTEKSFNTDDGKLRPDVIINMPGGRHIVVDSKTSTSAYMDAVEATDEEDKEQHLVAHARQIRNHMKQLSAKAYWDGLTVTPDFVVMFIPGDNFFSAALELDSKLFEDAVRGRVLMVTPTTLIALAKAVAYGWRQEKVAENYKHIANLGSDLYKRMSVMGGHIENLGKSLSASVSRFNEFVGSLESSVFPQARKFQELEVEGTENDLESIEQIERDIRELKGKDLRLTKSEKNDELEPLA